MGAILNPAFRGTRAASAAGCRHSGNGLLNVLDPENCARVHLQLETVRLESGTLVYPENDSVQYGYLPQSCAISLQRPMRDGSSVEFALVGREGMLGTEALLERGRMLGSATVIRAGAALRAPIALLKELFEDCRDFRAVVLAFWEAYSAQIVQRSACHRVHTIDQQLCTWLLLMHDRSRGNEIEATHETIGGLLGGRREGVSIAIRRLRKDGLLRSGYRSLVILNRDGIEARSCECYRATRVEYQRFTDALGPFGSVCAAAPGRI